MAGTQIAACPLWQAAAAKAAEAGGDAAEIERARERHEMASIARKATLVSMVQTTMQASFVRPAAMHAARGRTQPRVTRRLVERGGHRGSHSGVHTTARDGAQPRQQLLSARA